ncbi:MAG: hypothetical protein MHM6MM_004526, partial [Cercozoa sp. M6MM]
MSFYSLLPAFGMFGIGALILKGAYPFLWTAMLGDYYDNKKGAVMCTEMDGGRHNYSSMRDNALYKNHWRNEGHKYPLGPWYHADGKTFEAHEYTKYDRVRIFEAVKLRNPAAELV